MAEALIVRGWTPAAADKHYDAVCGITLSGPSHLDDSVYWGSGVLIAPRVVLTAKHIANLYTASQYRLSFRRDANGNAPAIQIGSPNSLMTFEVSSIVLHPSKDLALMLLPTDVLQIDPMRIDLTKLGVQIGGSVQVAGWGKQCDSFDGAWTTAGLRVMDGERIRFGMSNSATSTALTLLNSGYASDGSGCSTCVPTVNKGDSGGPIMRIDGDGVPTVLGVSVSPGQRFVMLTQLTAADPDDASFLEALSSSVATKGKLGFSPSRPLKFDTAGKLFTRARIGLAPNYTYFSEAPSSGLLAAQSTVAASAPFTLFQNGSSVASLVVSTIGAGACTGGSYEGQTVGYTEIAGAGTEDGLDVNYVLNVHSYGQTDHCDPGLKVYSYFSPTGATTGTTGVDDAMLADVPFTWEYNRLNGGVSAKAAFTPGLIPVLTVYADGDADGIEESQIEFPYELPQGPPVLNQDGLVEIELRVHDLEEHGRYRVKLRVRSDFAMSPYTSPGCDKTGTYDRAAEHRLRFTITPY